ncbi:MAG TPA: GNAT family N-acetyltransferase [Fimbriimonas sp.]|nr:GNAT family N-acetyltransferase [Fimbriimonas sp.]
MLTTKLFEGPRLFAELEKDWRVLANEDPSATPFQTWEWQSTWWNYFGGSKEPRALAVYEGQDLVGLMAFVRTAGAWRTLRSLGIGPSDYLQPLSRPGHENQAAEATRNYAAEASDIDLVDLHQLRETKPLVELTDPQTRIEQATCLVLDLPRTYDEYLKTLGKSLRYDVKRLDKSLFQEGKARIDLIKTGDLQSGYEIFLEQHKARWRKRLLPGAFLGKTVRFHRDWICHADRNGWLRMSLLRVDGEVAGAIYAMSFQNVVYYYQAGFDPSKSSISPGTLLVAHTIRTAIDEGAQRFDFMRGDEPYKRRWKPQHVWKNHRLLMYGAGARGRWGASWNERAWRVERRVRAKLEGGKLL